MPHWKRPSKEFRQRFHERLGRLRARSRDSFSDSRAQGSRQVSRESNSPETFGSPVNKHAAASSDALVTTSGHQSNDPGRHITEPSDSSSVDVGGILHVNTTDISQPSEGEQRLTQRLLGDTGHVAIPLDLWSNAFREAVQNLGSDIDVAILKGNNVMGLFKKLEELDKEATQESAFLRGVKYLHSIQVPLQTFKLALDVASPLASIEPTASTVFGVVRSVTAIVISLASADLEFAKQIGDMLEQISYIDDCDTLGQKSNDMNIHKALVSVYQKLLEFYKIAFEILTKRGTKLVLSMMMEKENLPEIVKDFTKHATILKAIIQKATWEIVEDIKSMLYDREITGWLGGDRNSRQRKYHADLGEIRSDEACEWLLTETNFVQWYRAAEGRQLAVLGDMGSGKTIAMAFLIDELSRRSKCRLPQPKVCFYYCRDDETGEAIHVFSALILALLEQLPGLKRGFYDWYKQSRVSGLEPATSVRKLEEFLLNTMGLLDRPIYIAIDGLDECKRTSRITILKLLERLLSSHPQLKVLLSSRPEEEILGQLTGSATVHLVADAQRDAAIVRYTVKSRLPYLTPEVRTPVVETLSLLACGSAIWTKIVVELIETRGIRALHPMRHFLDEVPLPSQLSELYDNLLTRCTSSDLDNRKLAVSALKLLAITRRPLSILELAWAVALDVAEQEVTTIAALAELVDSQRVLTMIRPFITRLDYTDMRKRQLRLVHQSVKEFIVKKHTTIDLRPQPSSHPSAPEKTLSEKTSQHLELLLLNLCIRYLLLEEVSLAVLLSDELMAIDALPQEFNLFDDSTEPIEYDPHVTWDVWEANMTRYDPTERGFGEFFVYASCHWLEHYGAVKTDHLPDLTSIEVLCEAGSNLLLNWTQQNCRPGCVIKARFEFNSDLYDPLSITSLYGSEAMLRRMLQDSDFGNGKFLDHSAFKAADQILQWGDLTRLRILFVDGVLGPQLQNVDFFRLVLGYWTGLRKRHQDWSILIDLVDHVLGISVRDHWVNELLCVATTAGCLPIVNRLMDTAQHDEMLRSELLSTGQCVPKVSPSSPPATHQSVGEAVSGATRM